MTASAALASAPCVYRRCIYNDLSNLCCAQNLVLNEISNAPEILPAFAVLGITSYHINEAIHLADQVCSKLWCLHRALA